ncbi:lipopolysaccharide biosynthesis protein [Pseudohongiella sp. SYSU M77423]|uniref:lipopolysaccharide biosynthesis protein n=1 Tax=Pseudohongiella sp. SYSU M77423 TaxID=3042312 RepID=UPI002480D845|nr:lipopolysaccharide biosynthesis protein [Pseudohongiella sp. SYSU M77423]MDH7944941.1 lipopolysaccharide biosynthesis protein [Pseudohongiella sp. SYSU M77423]
MKFERAFKWSILSEVSAKLVQPVVYLILANILVPEDFGVMTAAMMVVAFSQIFWEAGMGKALIQRQTHIEEAANFVFWANLAVGILIAGCLYQFASSIAISLFQDDRVIAVIQVMSLHVLLGAASSVQTALLRKSMEFKKLFWVRLLTVSAPGFASIPLALNGWGYWALVAGALAGQILELLVLWRVSPWRPTLEVAKSVSIQMGKFGGWVTLTGFLSWFYVWADTLVVGKFMGLSDLGLYRIGQQLTGIAFSLIFTSIIPVIYSHFSIHQNNRVRLQLETQQAIELGIWVAVPIGVVLYAHSHQLEHALFGPEWIGLATVIGLMSIRQAFASVTFINGEAYRAIGKPQYETIVLALSLIFYVPVYWYLAQIDMRTFLFGRIGLVIVSMIAHLYLISIFLKVNLLKIFNVLLIVTTASSFTIMAVNYITKLLIGNMIVQVFVSVAVSLFGLALIFYSVEKSGLMKVVLSFISRKS